MSWARLLGWRGSAGGRARGLLRIWTVVDAVESRRTRLRSVQPGSVLAYSLRRHLRRRVRLTDGTLVTFGDLVLEIHLNNRTMTRMASVSPWKRMELARAEMLLLAQMISAGRLGPVQAVHGTSLLGVVGRRMGFELSRLPKTWKWRIEWVFLTGMDVIHHPDGAGRLRRVGPERWPTEVWMSRAALLSRYR